MIAGHGTDEKVEHLHRVKIRADIVHVRNFLGRLNLVKSQQRTPQSQAIFRFLFKVVILAMEADNKTLKP